jgi:purine-binding chemotaxis protein CheW
MMAEGGSVMETRWRETLIFELAGRRFGVPASDVQELVRIVTITPPVPGPELIEGVINLRGSVVPVYDLRARLGLPRRAPEVSESLVIARREGRPFAFRIDRAVELATLRTGDVESSGLLDAGEDPANAVAKLPGGLAVLLDLESLMTANEEPARAGQGSVDRP